MSQPQRSNFTLEIDENSPLPTSSRAVTRPVRPKRGGRSNSGGVKKMTPSPTPAPDADDADDAAVAHEAQGFQVPAPHEDDGSSIWHSDVTRYIHLGISLAILVLGLAALVTAERGDFSAAVQLTCSAIVVISIFALWVCILGVVKCCVRNWRKGNVEAAAPVAEGHVPIAVRSTGTAGTAERRRRRRIPGVVVGAVSCGSVLLVAGVLAFSPLKDYVFHPAAVSDASSNGLRERNATAPGPQASPSGSGSSPSSGAGSTGAPSPPPGPGSRPVEISTSTGGAVHTSCAAALDANEGVGEGVFEVAAPTGARARALGYVATPMLCKRDALATWTLALSKRSGWQGAFEAGAATWGPWAKEAAVNVLTPSTASDYKLDFGTFYPGSTDVELVMLDGPAHFGSPPVRQFKPGSAWEYFDDFNDQPLRKRGARRELVTPYVDIGVREWLILSYDGAPLALVCPPLLAMPLTLAFRVVPTTGGFCLGTASTSNPEDGFSCSGRAEGQWRGQGLFDASRDIFTNCDGQGGWKSTFGSSTLLSACGDASGRVSVWLATATAAAAEEVAARVDEAVAKAERLYQSCPHAYVALDPNTDDGNATEAAADLPNEGVFELVSGRAYCRFDRPQQRAWMLALSKEAGWSGAWDRAGDGRPWQPSVDVRLSSPSPKGDYKLQFGPGARGVGAWTAYADLVSIELYDPQNRTHVVGAMSAAFALGATWEVESYPPMFTSGEYALRRLLEPSDALPSSRFLVLSQGGGVCIVSGAFGTGFNCDGNGGHSAGAGLFDALASDDFLGCADGHYPWRSSEGAPPPVDYWSEDCRSIGPARDERCSNGGFCINSNCCSTINGTPRLLPILPSVPPVPLPKRRLTHATPFPRRSEHAQVRDSESLPTRVSPHPGRGGPLRPRRGPWPRGHVAWSRHGLWPALLTGARRSWHHPFADVSSRRWDGGRSYALYSAM